jgi:hypothetical protein
LGRRRQPVKRRSRPAPRHFQLGLIVRLITFRCRSPLRATRRRQPFRASA